jgi:hypothetical protein
MKTLEEVLALLFRVLDTPPTAQTLITVSRYE